MHPPTRNLLSFSVPRTRAPEAGEGHTVTNQVLQASSTTSPSLLISTHHICRAGHRFRSTTIDEEIQYVYFTLVSPGLTDCSASLGMPSSDSRARNAEVSSYISPIKQRILRSSVNMQREFYSDGNPREEVLFNGCAQCYAFPKPGQPPFKRCSGCSHPDGGAGVAYCSPECQKKNWTMHR